MKEFKERMTEVGQAMLEDLQRLGHVTRENIQNLREALGADDDSDEVIHMPEPHAS